MFHTCMVAERGQLSFLQKYKKRFFKGLKDVKKIKLKSKLYLFIFYCLNSI